MAFLKKYVDDLVLILNPGKISDILTTFKSYHPQLSLPLNLNPTTPYLSMISLSKIQMEPAPLISTSNPPTLDVSFTTFLPNKFSTQNLIQRSLTLSDPSFHPNNISRLQEILLYNGFPSHIIKNLIPFFFNHPTPTSSLEIYLC